MHFDWIVVRILVSAVTWSALTAIQERATQPDSLRVGELLSGEICTDTPVAHSPRLDESHAKVHPNHPVAPTHGVSFRATLPAGTTTLDLRSYAFDAYLVVRNAQGVVVAENDDGLFEAHARVVLSIAADTAVEIVACALRGGHGPFELCVSAGVPAIVASRERKRAEIEEARQDARNIEEWMGADHPTTATFLDQLGWLLENEGNYEEARPLFERALAIREKAYGPEHLNTAASLNSLAALLCAKGKYAEARPLYERALAIKEKALGPDDPSTACSLLNLAQLLEAQGEHEEARELDERTVAILEKALGADHPATAAAFSNLAALLHAEGEHEEGRALLERALAIFERKCGHDSPGTAARLVNLAALLAAEGNYDEARPLLERALAIFETTLGREHPDTLSTEARLAELALDQDRLDDAREHAAKRLAGERAHALAQASLASESDARGFLTRQQEALALVLQTTPAGERSSDALYADVMLTKGATFRLASLRRHALEAQLDPELRATLERLQSVRAALSNLLSSTTPQDRSEQEWEIERLRKEREELETRLARAVHSQPSPARVTPVTPAAVRAALPQDAVLLELVEHRVYEPARWQDRELLCAGRWGGSRFSAWISRADLAVPTWIDLGPSDAIEIAVTRYLESLVGVRGASALATIRADESRAPTIAELAMSVRELVWDPVAAQIGNARRVLLCADGVLATLPFGVLVDRSGQHLIERHSFSQIEDAASLARPLEAAPAIAPTRSAAPSLLVAGAIDYETAAVLDRDLVASPERRGSFTFTWDPLSLTGSEADGVAARHQRRFASAPCLLLLGSAPSEERLKHELPNYDVLHLATHGYFLVDELESISAACPEDGERTLVDTPERRLLAGYWPESLCGIVCAGANHPQPDRDNGLLTGDEVGSLDLSACNLVVLSACETALGKRHASEGLLSLTRSFRTAGARTVISSLWQVRDDSTRELMLDFYDRLWNRNESKLDALRDAQLSMLKRNREKLGDTKPAMWGAFVLTGEAE